MATFISNGEPITSPSPQYDIPIVCNNGVLKVRNKSGLPLGYQAVEYLESSGTQWIDTGIVPDNDTGFSVTLQCVDTPTDNFIYGAREGADGRFVAAAKATALYFGYGTQTNTPGMIGAWNNCTPSNKNNVKLNYKNSNIAQVNNSQDAALTSTLPTFDANTTITLFGRNGNGTVVCFAQRVYDNEITQGNNVIRNYIPCRRNSDNVLGMYDLVSQTFLTNAGSGTFTAGSDVDDMEIYTDGTVETVTDSLGNTANAERLLAVGDYKDTQEVLSGSVTRNIGVKVFDGTESWNYYSVTQGNMFRIQIADSVSGAKDTLGVLCNAYTVTTTSSRADNTLSGASKNFDFINNNYTTSDDWKAYLAQQYQAGTPVIVVYPLATATTETVTGQPLSIQAGTNIVSITQASIDNLELEVSYKATV